MAFGIYVHIPYCLQRCTYCDFATYEKSALFPSSEYIDLVLEELSQKSGYFPARPLDTLYFGGGTPSLLPASEILSLIRALEKKGFPLKPEAEVTIEINPATVDRDKLVAYLDMGINRFSVGAQTFDDRLLKMVKREHDSRQTLETLSLLASRSVNFSFDLLFALPTQEFAGLERDLEIALDCGAQHISPYCLTVPESHPLSDNRPLEEVQVAMFALIDERLSSRGFSRYEISNYALPGRESRHNLLYWTDDEYWGLGLSAHSYRKSGYGQRFWNLSNIHEYRRQIESQQGLFYRDPEEHLMSGQSERLKQHQALTDFCHTSLRLKTGLSRSTLMAKFPRADHQEEVEKRCRQLKEKGWLQPTPGGWTLSPQGLVLSNQVFTELTFLERDFRPSSH